MASMTQVWHTATFSARADHGDRVKAGCRSPAGLGLDTIAEEVVSDGVYVLSTTTADADLDVAGVISVCRGYRRRALLPIKAHRGDWRLQLSGESGLGPQARSGRWVKLL